MKREEKFGLINELSKAVTDKTVYEHELHDDRVEYLANTRTLKINKNIDLSKIEDKKEVQAETEEELFAKIYAQRNKQ